MTLSVSRGCPMTQLDAPPKAPAATMFRVATGAAEEAARAAGEGEVRLSREVWVVDKPGLIRREL